MKITLIVFTKNEEENLKVTLPKIPKNLVNKIYAVDGGSADKTREILQKNKVKIIDQKYKGVGGAYEAAFSNTKEEYLIFFHPDGNMNPQDIEEFVKRIKDGQDFIVASRMIKGARNEEDSNFFKPRKWFCILLGIIANIFWSKNGNKTSDVTQGFRAIGRKVYKKMGITIPDPIAPDYEQVIKALKKNIKIYEFPTVEKERIYGDTSMPSIKTGIANIKVLLREIKSSIPPNL